MKRKIDLSLKDLKDELLKMAILVESAIDQVSIVLKTSHLPQMSKVHSIEKQVNESHISVDANCVKILALQNPLAADLRLIVSVIKINTDLERMGDQAVNIAYNAEKYLKNATLELPLEFLGMFKEVQFMVREALDSFVQYSEPLARDVLKRDDEVDKLKDKIFKVILSRIKTNPDQIESGLSLILISRNLEKIGDHATNIAEDVIFMTTGKDIRHPGLGKKSD